MTVVRARTSFGYAILGQALYRLSSLLVVLAAASTVSVAELGEFNLLLSYSVTAGAVIIFGFDVLLNRETSAGRQRKGAVRAILLLKAVGTVLVTPVAIAVTGAVVGTAALPLLLVVLSSAVLAAFAETFETVLVGRRQDRGRAAAIGGAAVVALGLLAVPFAVGTPAGVWYLALVLVVRDAVRIGIASTLAGAWRSMLIPVPGWGTLPPLLRGSAPFALVAVAAYLAQRIDLTIIQVVLGPDQLGLYTPAATIALGAAVVPSGIGPLVIRTLSSDPTSLVRLGAVMFLGGAVLAVVIIAVFPILTGTVLPAAYRASTGVLALLAAAIPFSFLNSVLLRKLYVLGRETAVWKLLLGSTVVNVVLNLILLPRLGLLGAGVSTVISEVLLTVLLFAGLALRGRRVRTP